MDSSFNRHFSEEVWNEYALGERSENDCQALEEHLLVCFACQDLLAQADEHIRLTKAAIRCYIANFTTLQDGEEQELLPKMADVVATRAFIRQIVNQYKIACAVRDLEISMNDLLIEKFQFWWHITRLRLAWFLRVTNALPDFRQGLVARSVLSLSVLSPRLLEVL
ncbi:MAG: hypothetical protein JOZ32_04170 [Bryobacterales bacterium]|nr:hypothetical protein [Bryobacterales bacterium]